MKNRKAWGLVAVLSTVMLGATALMGTHFVVSLPRHEWGFGLDYITTGEAIGPNGQHFILIQPGIKLGFVGIKR
jgi:hypothetical protein